MQKDSWAIDSQTAFKGLQDSGHTRNRVLRLLCKCVQKRSWAIDYQATSNVLTKVVHASSTQGAEATMSVHAEGQLGHRLPGNFQRAHKH